jgi:DNA-binding NtrC family response regulator
VELSSEPGVGTVVSAHFPATGDAVAPDEGDRPAPARAVSASERVLVVEDDPSMRRMAERILRRAGYAVETSPGGRDALRKLETDERFDMLLTDVVMPEMSGTELAGRAAALYPDLRILLMSGYVDRPGVGPVEDGAELLEKPFRADDLLGKVRDVLESEPRAARQPGP